MKFDIIILSNKERKENFLKEYLYVGHYYDVENRYILKIGTTNELERRRKEHTRNYRKAEAYRLPKGQEFIYDWHIKLSKYNTLRFEDRTRQAWQEQHIGEFVRNDRFLCPVKPEKVEVTIRKTYEVPL